MEPVRNYKIVVTVPTANADTLRSEMAKAGGGKVGLYTNCSFSSKGIGRFMAGEGAHPAIGDVGVLEEVEEDKVEINCSKEVVGNVIAAIKRIHPYETPVIDIYPLEDW